MKRLYEKNKLLFTLAWIAAYVLSFPFADRLSALAGMSKSITAPWGLIFALLMIGFLAKNKLTEEYGLCKFKGRFKDVWFFIPFIPILGLYFYNGVAWNGTILEAVLCVVSMLCIGFIEEMLFRGFLFKTMCKDNVKVAVLVSSVLFGMGHFVNFLGGRELISTLLQMCYATALGFLLTTLFYKGKSLLPCIVIHCFCNVLSVFHVPGTMLQSMISSGVLCVLCAAYALWIWKNLEKKERQADE